MNETAKDQAEFLQEQYDLFSPTFKDNKILIKVLRKAILGIELSPTEKDLLKTIPQSVIDAVEHRLVHKVTGDEDIYKVNDFWFQFNLKERSEFQVDIDITYLPIVLEFFENSIKRINGKESTLSISDLEYSKSKTNKENIVNVISRNIVLSTTEGIISNIYMLANTKPLTEAEIKAIQSKNSSR
jgi:hypothetical protein